MARILYNILFTLLLPFVFVRMWWKGRVSPAYRNRLAERIGLSKYKPSEGSLIWFHTVSVGETIAAAPLIEACISDDRYSRVLVTTMTPTGSDRVIALFGNKVEHVYCPWDHPWAVALFLKRWKPSVAVMMETEIWPNTIRQLSKRNTPVFLANARMSERSARGYQKVSALTKPSIQAFTGILAQNHADAQRFITMGASPDRVHIVGSVKFDIHIDDGLKEKVESIKAQLSSRPIWVAASTHEGEEEIILAAHKRIIEQHRNALLIIVPRHPERFDLVFSMAQRDFSTERRTCALPSSTDAVWVGDTMGELMMMMGVSNLAFIGGSLLGRGGHNPLEAALWSLPILTGPDVFNFQTLYDEMRQDKAVILSSCAEQISEQVIQCFEGETQLLSVGEHAYNYLNRHRGAVEKQLSHINTI